MMFKKLGFIVLACLVFVGCSATKSENMVTISGTIANPIPQGEIILEKLGAQQVESIATVHANDDGKFEIETEINAPGFYRINVYGQQFEIVVLDDEDLKVEADGQGGQDITVTGSKDMKYMAQVMEYMSNYQNVVREFNTRYAKAQQAGDNLTMEEMFDEGMALEAQKLEKLKSMAWSMDDSIVPLIITDYFSDKSEAYDFLDSLGAKLQEQFPNSSDVQFFVNNLPAYEPNVRIGDVAPDITLPTPSGEMASLSDLRGKYVLLDFWAGWCGPCRKENPNVVNMYKRYNDDGFEVFSVSLDRTRERWVDAIQADGLIWPNHVSDLKYFQSAAAIKYKVDAIPFALLLDPDGKVIGKNLRGRNLEKKLQSIFEDKAN